MLTITYESALRRGHVYLKRAGEADYTEISVGTVITLQDMDSIKLDTFAGTGKIQCSIGGVVYTASSIGTNEQRNTIYIDQISSNGSIIGISGEPESGTFNPVYLNFRASAPTPTTYNVNTASIPSGSGSVSGGGSYAAGTQIHLTNTPNSSRHAIFDYWENLTTGATSTSSTYDLVVNRAYNIKAHFIERYQVSVTAQPGGSVTGAGLYNVGNTCTVTATADANYRFAGWYKGDTLVSNDLTYSFGYTTGEYDVTLVAHFESTTVHVTITTNVEPSGSGTTTGSGTYIEGLTYTVTATANSGYVFNGWYSGNTLLTINTSYSNVASTSITLTARFRSTSHTVSVQALPSNGGTVTGGGTYTEGQTYTVTAQANQNYEFVNWTKNGDVVSTSSSYSGTLGSSDVSLIAKFKSTLTFDTGLYTSSAEMNKVDKSSDLTLVSTLQGTLREECELLQPSILLAYNELPNFNYVYIASFGNRYYFVKDIISVRTGLWRIDLDVDVLMTYKDKILQQEALIERNEFLYDANLVDDLLIAKCGEVQQTIVANKYAFNDNGGSVVISTIDAYNT